MGPAAWAAGLEPMRTTVLESLDRGDIRESLPTPQTVGAVAGEVWRCLRAGGKTSVIRLKSEVRCSATVLHLSLGWLLREDKVEFSNEKGQLMVRLKE
jgi:hypothetical protein